MAHDHADAPLRADARRNRTAMLAAARKLFAERGLHVPLEAIAEAAGVSRATQHRHFPNRESLVLAIIDDNIDTLARRIEQIEDPSEKYQEALIVTAESLRRDLGFVDLFNDRNLDPAVKHTATARYRALLQAPLSDAQAAGRIRADLQLDDSLVIADMLSGVVAATGPTTDLERHLNRALALILDAIRGPAATATPISPENVAARAGGHE